MKKVDINETAHQNLNPAISHINTHLTEVGFYFAYKLEDVMKERGLTVRKLAELSGLRLATISDLMLGKKSNVNLQHVALLMAVLRLSDINELIEIVLPEQEKEVCKQDSENWKNTGELPPFTKYIAEHIKNGEA